LYLKPFVYNRDFLRFDNLNVALSFVIYEEHSAKATSQTVLDLPERAAVSDREPEPDLPGHGW
jgi:hypothetical protein